MSNRRRTSQNSVRKSRRDLFVSKRKSKETFPNLESPSKFLAISNDSSDDDIRVGEEEVRPAVTLKKNNLFGATDACTQFQIFSDDSDGSETAFESNPDRPTSETAESQWPRSIVECKTPVKQTLVGESQSPVKTPVLRPLRGKSVNHNNDINEYASPTNTATPRRRSRRRPAVSSRSDDDIFTTTESEICEYATQRRSSRRTSAGNIGAGSNDSDGNMKDRRSTTKSRSKNLHSNRKRTKEKEPPKLLYSVKDAPCLDAVIIRTTTFDDEPDATSGSATLWALFHDVVNECERYLLVEESTSKRIKPGFCLKLFSPWTVSKLQSGEEVVHVVGGYQIVIPPLLQLTTDMYRSIVGKKSSPYSKFLRSRPGQSSLEVLKSFQVSRPPLHSLAKQLANFASAVNIDASIDQIFPSSNRIVFLLHDSDYTHAILEAPCHDPWTKVEKGTLVRILDVGFGGILTHYMSDSLMSILASVGAAKKCLKLLWRPTCTIQNSLSSAPFFNPNTLEKETNQLALGSTRKTISGVVISAQSQTLVIEENELQMNVLVLPKNDCCNRLGGNFVGRHVEARFVRVTGDFQCVMDEYSSLVVVPSLLTFDNF